MSLKGGILRSSGLTVFDVKDLAALLSLPLPSARVAASRLCRRGILRRLRKDLYILPDKPLDDPQIANRLLSPSYISFESALNYWGLSTQIPRSMMSASLRSKKYRIEGTEFLYYRLPPALFRFGYRRERDFFIASPEKALLDTAYYASLGRKGLSDEIPLSKLNRITLKKMLASYPKKTQELLRERLK